MLFIVNAFELIYNFLCVFLLIKMKWITEIYIDFAWDGFANSTEFIFCWIQKSYSRVVLEVRLMIF